MFLTTDQLVELTGKRQRAAQVRVLRAMGVDHLVRPDGSPAVLEAVLRKRMGLAAQVTPRAVLPDWSALG